MIDLHSHILPGIDDGAPTLDVALDMARHYTHQGVTHVACTPHILPGVYHNTGPDIRLRVATLQHHLDEAGIALRLLTGADNHMVGNFTASLGNGHLLTLADTAFVLVEPPHQVAPARVEDLFFALLIAGYTPILTHPERLTWIEQKYPIIERLAERGVWMQITAGSLRSVFGRRPRYWAERMLSEGRVHILASDAHNVTSRRPDLAEGRDAAASIVGASEAHNLVVTRPSAVLSNMHPKDIPSPGMLHVANQRCVQEYASDGQKTQPVGNVSGGLFGGRLLRIFR